MDWRWKMPDLSEFQTQNLILLIGTNPLPNEVNAMTKPMMVREDSEPYGRKTP